MMAEAYWDGTRDHDVSQNHTSFLDAIENDPPYSILDLGCGPGRDLHHFRLLGQQRCRPGRIDGTRGYGTKRRWLRTRCRRPRARGLFCLQRDIRARSPAATESKRWFHLWSATVQIFAKS